MGGRDDGEKAVGVEEEEDIDEGLIFTGEVERWRVGGGDVAVGCGWSVWVGNNEGT